MKLTEITAQPKLVKVTIDDEDTVKEYGEGLEFYTWDRQPMTVFIKLAEAEGGKFGNIVEVMKDLILTEEGKPIMAGELVLPSKILMRAIGKLTDLLGK